MSLPVTMLTTTLVPDLENAEEREVICTGERETALNYQCLTSVYNASILFCLSVPGPQGEILSYQHDKDLRKRGRKHCPGPEE